MKHWYELETTNERGVRAMITIKRLAREMRMYEGDDDSHAQGAYEALRSLLDESIAPQDHAIYVFVCNHDNTTASEIVDEFGVQINQASTALKRLVSYGLLDRQSVTDDDGLHWEYSQH